MSDGKFHGGSSLVERCSIQGASEPHLVPDTTFAFNNLAHALQLRNST